MDRAAVRTESQYARARKHTRKSYRGPLSIFVPRLAKDLPPEKGNEGCIPAWSYSLSQGGVGLIMLEKIFVTDIWIGVHLPNQDIRWMFGQIVRRRPIPEEDFLDYGITFLQKPADPTTSAE